MRPVAIVGHLSRDLIEGGPPRVGGGAFHCARGLRAIARDAVVVTKVAEGERRLLDEVIRLGIPVRWRRAESMPGFEISYDGETRRMVVDSIGDVWTEEDADGWVRHALRGVEWLHVAPLARSDFPPETLAVLARRRRLSLDGQGLVRPPRRGPLVLDADYDAALLDHVSILKLSEDEAAVVAGGFDERSLRKLGVPEVVVTLGAEGSIVLADGLAEHVPVRPRAFDPTGAGDVFAAVYLAARASGAAPIGAARRASTVACDVLEGAA